MELELTTQLTELQQREELTRQELLEAKAQLEVRDAQLERTLEQLRAASAPEQLAPQPEPSTAIARSDEYSEYQQLITRVREVVNELTEPGATILVVSKGDNELLKFDRRTGWHFPQNDWGVYAGHYPGESSEAIAHLAALQSKGADYFLLPQTSFWWLDHYREFKQYLEGTYPVVIRRDDTCIIFALRQQLLQSEPLKPQATRTRKATARKGAARKTRSSTTTRRGARKQK